MPIEKVTDDEFQDFTSDGITLVDFWAPWCGPCKMVAPILEELASERGDVAFGKLNVDENPLTAQRFRVMSIPTVLVLKDGEVVDSLVGAQPKAAYEKAIRRYAR